jgi:hypothetical protein
MMGDTLAEVTLPGTSIQDSKEAASMRLTIQQSFYVSTSDVVTLSLLLILSSVVFASTSFLIWKEQERVLLQ